MSGLIGAVAAGSPAPGGLALYEGIADSLRERIFAHRLAPGSPVDEVALARHYGVSRTPVREAVKVLASEGLLEVVPYRGCRVARIAGDDLAAALDVVELIARHALLRLLGQAEAAGRMRLSQAAAGGSWAGFCHIAVELLAQPSLAAVSRNLHQQLQLCLGPALAFADRGGSPALRAALCQAIEQADPAAVLAAYRELAADFRVSLLGACDEQQREIAVSG
ncbi:GntR family transcriptional regulator [Azonexus caeni]|jgi:DNA-binding GntR family transcriptional regulator|uniref:GntR family transcriptional regulator n=1 Tax=Azonexus caeni TaxID=266126 RepID=UPI003A8C21EE